MKHGPKKGIIQRTSESNWSNANKCKSDKITTIHIKGTYICEHNIPRLYTGHKIFEIFVFRA